MRANRNRTLFIFCLVFFIFLPATPASAAAVRITGVTPSIGAADENTPVTISGLNFDATTEVTIGGKPVAELIVVDSRTLRIKTPKWDLLPGETEHLCDVTVSIDGSSDTLENGFKYVLPVSHPSITEIYDRELFCREGHVAANSGPLEGGNTIVIVGSDFRTAGDTLPVVEFGHGEQWTAANVLQVVSINPGQAADYELGLPAYLEGQRESAIIAVAPPGAATGAVDVRVTNPDTGSTTMLNAWIYKICNLVVSEVTPGSGPVTGNTEVVISGANFDEDVTLGVEFVHRYEDGSTETTVVEDNRFIEVTSTQIHINLPPSIEGMTDVVVYNRFGRRTLVDGFFYTAPESEPWIDSITPNHGTARGGDVIEIAGGDFRNNSVVLFGDNQAEVLSAIWDTLVVLTPPGEPGSFDVMVVNPDGYFCVEPEGYTYISYPEISFVSPSVVNTAGGTIVTVTGDQFYTGAEVVLEKDGVETVSEEVRVVDTNIIYARVPAVAATGFYDVIVRNSDHDPDAGLGEAVLEEGIMFEDPPGMLPVVQDIYPDRGPVEGGIDVVVACDNAREDAQIFIGLEEAQVEEYLGDGRFRINLPPNAEGDYYVTVTNPDGGTGVSEDAIFQYRIAVTYMSITSVTPNSGSTAGGTYVTIRGFDFRSGAEVYFGSEQATDVSVSLEDPISGAYKISCYTPPGSIGFVDVAVINPDNTFGVALVKNGFNYRSPASVPEITSVTPFSGPTTGGTRITVVGEDFRSGLKLYLDGIEALDVVLVDSQTITAVVPAHSPGKTVVSVVNYDGGSFAFGDTADETGFVYAVPGSAPEVYSVEPDFGPAGKTTLTTITGLDFRINAKVYFGSVESPEVTYVDYQTLTALAPAQDEGRVDVTVVNEDFGTGTLKNGFTYRSSAPRIIRINPSMGDRAGGDIVTIIGEEFVVEYEGEELTLVPDVYFQQGEYIAVAEVLPGSTSEALIISTPAAPNGVIGFYDVRVVNFDEAEDILEKGFKYTAPDSEPEISSIDPASGPVQGGTPIKIFGNDFREDAWVFIGGKEAAGVQVVDGTTIKAITPPHTPGAKDVTVVNYDGGSFTLEDGFTYNIPESEPIITSVTPNKGPQIGGTDIIITGRDFREGIEVYIGGEPCTGVTYVDYRTVTAVTPAGTVGPADVTVTNADLGSFTLESGFTYILVDIPVIISVTPNEGVSGGGTEIAVVGENFENGLSLTIGGVPADVVKVTSTQIDAVTPPGEVGFQDIMITNPAGGWVILEDGFKYIRERSEPDTPGSLEATAVDKSTVKLEWDTAEFAAYYEIFVRKSGEDFRFVDQTRSDDCTYYVTGLQPGTTYYFQVRAVNELGLSGFTATDSARTKSGSSGGPSKDEQDQVQEVFGPGTRTLTAASKAALRDCGYTFDFRDVVSPQNPVSIVQVNADTALDIQEDVTVKLVGCRLRLPPGLWNLPQINSLSARECRQSVVRIIIVDSGSREAEKAAAYLPSGTKVISRVYSLHLEVISRGQTQSVELFPYPISISFDLPVGSGLRNIAVYSRNLNGVWGKAPGASTTLLSATAYTYAPTTFLVAGIR